MTTKVHTLWLVRVAAALAPTDAKPGSKEKRRVLAERASLGLDLFNPSDRLWPKHHRKGGGNAEPGLAPRATA
jgi:hypothetical protein